MGQNVLDRVWPGGNCALFGLGKFSCTEGPTLNP